MNFFNKLQNPQIKPASLILILGISLVLIPHFSHLPLWLTLSICFSIFWQTGFELKIWQRPGKKMLFLLILLLLLGVILNYQTLLGKNAGSAMLLGLLCLKLFEIKSFRDISVIINLCLFTIVINFLFNQSIVIAFTMLTALVFLFTALIGFQHDYKKLNKQTALSLSQIRFYEKQHFKLAAKMLLQAIPFAVVLFVLFPRIDGPLWGLPHDAFSGTTGLSDKMSPGKISRLSDNSNIAFRVKFHTKIPAADKLYWRGPVMWDFNGYNWTAPEAERREVNHFQYTSLGKKTTYSITIQPHNKFWMFALDIPSTIPPTSLLTIDMQLLSVLPIQKLQRFKLNSYTRYILPSHPKISFDRYLKLPNAELNLLSKSKALMQRLKDDNDPQKTIDNVLTFFATENFYYSRQPPLLYDDPTDEFLFKTKRGYCEHYASSFTVLMRLAGIPARVVTGYQGGELNPINNYLTVRQTDAHAWSEVFLEEKGWVRVDPTAAIPPINIENIADALRLNSTLKKPTYIFKTNWISQQTKRVRFAWDAINNSWNQWVLGYNNKKQLAFFASVGLEEISWQGLSYILFSILSLFAAILAFIVFSNSTKNKTIDEAQKVYLRFLKKIKKQGLIKKETEGADDFAKRAAKQLPKDKASIHLISRLYQSLRYNKISDKNLNSLKKQVAHFQVR